MAEKSHRNPARADKLIRSALALAGNDSYVDTVASAIRSSADPDNAALAFARFAESLPSPDLQARFKNLLADSRKTAIMCSIFGASEYLTHVVLREPLVLFALFDDPHLDKPKPRAVMAADLAAMRDADANVDGFMRDIRRFRNREMLRIVARDLTGIVPLEEITGEISDLASVALDAARDFAMADMKRTWGEPFEIDATGKRPARLSILGMGKLGGRELNYSSDVDPIYIFGSDVGILEGGSLTGKTLLDYWSKVGEHIVKLLGDPTEDGIVFRVDLRLRPRGSSGAVASSLESAVDYYLTWGRTWERAAMLKARPTAGYIALGERFLEELGPWLNRRYLDFGLLDEIREMKDKVDIEARRTGRGDWNVKLGSGGIREIEFFVQSLQLVHGGKTKKILMRSTLDALRAIHESGFISAEDCKELCESYRFLRRLEHCIQFHQFQQTQRLPRSVEDRDRVAAVMGFEGPLSSRWADFETALDQRRAEVEARYRGLLIEPGEAHDEAVHDEAAMIAHGELGRAEAEAWLKARGFDDPDAAFKTLERLKDGPRKLAYLSDASKSRWKDIAPLVIRETASAPDPDMALVNLEKFLTGVGARATTLALLRRHDRIVKFLANLFGSSEYLSEFFISRPDLLDGLVGPKREEVSFDRDKMKADAVATIGKLDDLEERLDWLRLYTHERILDIGLDDLEGNVSQTATSERLTAVAETALCASHEIARLEIEPKWGPPIFSKDGASVGGSMVVMGMGKLGGGELSYGSDLDVIFLYDPANAETPGGLTSHEYFVKIAQRIISALTIDTAKGSCYRLDTRLRPSGRAGSLVVSIDGFEKYHRESGAAWERQALVKMRPVAGDIALGEAALKAVEPHVYGKPLTAEDLDEIRRIRQRMIDERARSGGSKIDLKLDPGGLADAEFVTQIVQLKYGGGIRELTTPSTSRAIEAMKGVMPEADRAALFEGWDFLRRAAMRLRITSAPESPVLDVGSKRNRIVAKALGYAVEGGDASAFVEDVKKQMAKIRELFVKYV